MGECFNLRVARCTWGSVGPCLAYVIYLAWPTLVPKQTEQKGHGLRSRPLCTAWPLCWALVELWSALHSTASRDAVTASELQPLYRTVQ